MYPCYDRYRFMSHLTRLLFSSSLKEIHKMLVPINRSFNELSYAHDLPESSFVWGRLQILQLQTDANKAERSALGQTIS